MILTFILFFIIVFGLSFIADIILGKNKSSLFEQFFIRIGIGLLLYAVLGVLMDLLMIPLNIWIIAIISILIPIYYIYSNKIKINKINWKSYFKINSKKNAVYYLIVFILFLLTANMYLGGSFSYDYFEKGDPWGYAMVSKQIAMEETFKVPYKYYQYAEPYTQGYQIVMGTLHQSNDSIYLTMKIFHNLIISLSIVWFFFMVRQLFSKRKENTEIALFSTFVLFAIPSWVSHFVFSLHYNMALLLVTLYAVFKIQENANWKWVAALLYAGIILNHFFTALMLTAIIIFYYFSKVLIEAKFNKEIIQVVVYGFLTSLIYYIPTNIRHSDYVFNYVYESHGGLEQILNPIANAIINHFYVGPLILGFIGLLTYLYFTHEKWFKPIAKQLEKTSIKISIMTLIYAIFIYTLYLPHKSLLFVKGSASRVYTLNDFINATSVNMINNPVGWGIIISIITLIGFIFILAYNTKLLKKENLDIFFTFNLTLLFIYLVMGMSHSVTFIPFRQWTFLAIFISIFVGFTLYKIMSQKKYYSKNLGLAIVTVFIFFVLTTSFPAKYELNHDMIWNDYQIFHPQSFGLYSTIREEIPTDTKLANICKRTAFVASYGVMPPIFDRDFFPEFRKEYDGNYERLIRNRFFEENLSNQYIAKFLLDKDIEYFTVGASCLGRRSDANITDFQNKINRMVLDPKTFTVIAATPSEFLFKVNKIN
jgi:hypothetical protein